MEFRLWTSIWKLLFVRKIPSKDHKTTIGECDHENRVLKVVDELRGLERLDTIIHEMLHAVLPEKDELWVESVASDMANVLWETGYRNVKEKRKPSK